jgi:beta-lactamase class A
MKKALTFIIIPLLILAACAGFLVHVLSARRADAQRQRLLDERRRAAWRQLEEQVQREASRFKGSLGVVIKDLRTKATITFNHEKAFPSASLAKLPVMAACYRAAQEGKIGLDDRLKLRSSDRLGGSGLLKNMPEGCESLRN